MKRTSAARQLVDQWSQSCCKGLLFSGTAYLIVVFLALPTLALIVLGSWYWVPTRIQLSSLAFALAWGLLWGTGNCLRARLARR